MSEQTHTPLTAQERNAIKAWAVGSPGCGLSVRDEAIAAHRAMLARNRIAGARLPYGDPYFEFMREVDCPVPDLGLRAKYRREIVESSEISESLPAVSRASHYS